MLSLVVAMAFAFWGVVGPAWGQLTVQPPPPEAVGPVRGVSPTQAATDAAIKGLADQINRLPLGAKLSVGQYLDAVAGHPFMVATLQRAQVIGGARQLGGGVVQIRLDITGRLVADALAQIAAVNARRTRYTPEFVIRETRAWADRTFTAIGISTGQVGDATAMAQVPPQAVDAAKKSATLGLLNQIATLPVTEKTSTKDLLALPGVTEAVTGFVFARPVRAVEAQSGGVFHIFLTMDGPGFFDVLRTSATRAGAPVDEAGWAAFRGPLLANIPAEIEGISLPGAGAPAAPPTTRLSFPTDRPPDWFFQSIVVVGSAPSAGSKLQSGQNAEVQARAELARLLETLPLASGLSLGEASKQDRRFSDVIPHAVERARVYSVDYMEDGSVRVKLSTDPRYIWQDIVVAVQSRP
jgi:hypothetical protein